MTHPFEIERIDTSGFADFTERLKQIYAAMDDAYSTAADHYDFTCDGCRDNCCQTRFYHHTIIEYAYLKEGFATLRPETQSEVISRAAIVVDTIEKADVTREAVRMMCPLNVDTRCILYPYRPMICRLHGIPHELKKPGQDGIRVPGCDTFDSRCSHRRYLQFDRTPFYGAMAGLEIELKQALDFSAKFKMSVAQMLLNFHS